MNQEQIRELTAGLAGELVETHISWVILRPDVVYKIKKPLRFDFLDFSTLELRRHFCAEELALNRRLAPQMYLAVVPIGLKNGVPAPGVEPAIDFAVKMQRMDNRLEMDRLLTEGSIRPEQMEQLADILVVFHRQNALKGPGLYQPGAVWTDFSEIGNYLGLMEKRLGGAAATRLAASLPELESGLLRHEARLQQRALDGFWVEGHGDLHSRNIFMTDPPTAFDCIEFNAKLRRMDLLNDLAFLLMDLDFYHRPDLAAVFLARYRKRREIMPVPEDALLLLFFKAYRANVRLKTGLLELEQHRTEALELTTAGYWRLLSQYIGALQDF